MRIAEAARALGMSPRMLRYRERLGLVPRVRGREGRAANTHRQYTPEDLRAIELARELEDRFDVSPAALAFALRAMTEPDVATAVRRLGEALGRLPATRVDETERERALRWLGRSGVLPPPRPVRRYPVRLSGLPPSRPSGPGQAPGR
ncbi:MerR family transcriptional regulator [Thermasporomyces composti]|uniref:MerR-like DNA binding protein n=1 Tax=Thermasporomyces composti TaxID=696763 RepID=A0A3D9V7P0_THECX|nr:MerR family transcriptional regulator [Thermasporomyces composti]REF37527.1 MerR-like DNA binding protein [Thermasporomyces composti]